MMDENVTIEELLRTSRNVIAECKQIVKEVQKRDLVNETWFLDWLDELNEISVKY